MPRKVRAGVRLKSLQEKWAIQYLIVGFADQSMAVKGTLYDLTKKETLRVGTTVMLMNTIIKRNPKTIVITNKCKVVGQHLTRKELRTRLGSRQSTD